MLGGGSYRNGGDAAYGTSVSHSDVSGAWHLDFNKGGGIYPQRAGRAKYLGFDGRKAVVFESPAVLRVDNRRVEK